MSKDKLNPTEALNGINLGLTTTGFGHVFEQLKLWPTDQLAAVLLEALFQRNQLLVEKKGDKDK